MCDTGRRLWEYSETGYCWSEPQARPDECTQKEANPVFGLEQDKIDNTRKLLQTEDEDQKEADCKDLTLNTYSLTQSAAKIISVVYFIEKNLLKTVWFTDSALSKTTVFKDLFEWLIHKTD